MPKPITFSDNDRVVKGKANAEAVFWSKVDKDGPIHPEFGQCWIWLGGRYQCTGKAYCYVNCKQVNALQFSYELKYGKIEDAKKRAHPKCLNNACVNPDHAEFVYIGQRLTKEEQFWRYVDKNGLVHPIHGQCWSWKGTKHSWGYGEMWSGNVQHTAHRISWEIHYGKIPEDKWVLHKCDNPVCSNPEHLFLGTTQENTRDKCDKDRNVYGTRHVLALLNDDIVRFCRKVYTKFDPKYNGKSLAKLFDVSSGLIYSAIYGKSWPYVDDSLPITNPYLLSLLEEFNNRPIPVKSNKIVLSKNVTVIDPSTPKKIVLSKNVIVVKRPES